MDRALEAEPGQGRWPLGCLAGVASRCCRTLTQLSLSRVMWGGGWRGRGPRSCRLPQPADRSRARGLGI